jgi:hypothetical protein
LFCVLNRFQAHTYKPQRAAKASGGRIAACVGATCAPLFCVLNRFQANAGKPQRAAKASGGRVAACVGA